VWKEKEAICEGIEPGARVCPADTVRSAVPTERKVSRAHGQYENPSQKHQAHDPQYDFKFKSESICRRKHSNGRFSGFTAIDSIRTRRPRPWTLASEDRCRTKTDVLFPYLLGRFQYWTPHSIQSAAAFFGRNLERIVLVPGEASGLPRGRKAPAPGSIESNRTGAGTCRTGMGAGAKSGRRYRADLAAATGEPLGIRTCRTPGGCVCAAASSESAPAAIRRAELKRRWLPGVRLREKARLTFSIDFLDENEVSENLRQYYQVACFEMASPGGFEPPLPP